MVLLTNPEGKSLETSLLLELILKSVPCLQRQMPIEGIVSQKAMACQSKGD